MAFPRWMYQDPSKHVDYIREKRKEYEGNGKGAKQRRAREGVERLCGGQGCDDE